MKKILVLAALTMAAAPAMASKARLNALNNSEQLKDAQTVFTRPSDLVGLGNWATIELGANAGTTVGTVTSPSAEGGFARSYGDGYLGFYLGHRNATVTDARNATIGGTALAEENPVEVYYAAKAGDLAWGASVWYSSSNLKSAPDKKQSSMGVRGSVEVANVDAYVHVGLTDTAQNSATTKYKGMPMTVGAGYTMGDHYFFANTTVIDSKYDAGAGDQKYKGSDYKLGYVNSMKSEGSNFFWGVAYTGSNRGADLGNSASTNLPIWIGIEQEAASWLTLRGSLSQTILLGSVKAGTEWDSQANNTTANAGVGLKWNKLLVDAAIGTATGGATQGNITGDNLLANAALTYMF